MEPETVTLLVKLAWLYLMYRVNFVYFLLSLCEYLGRKDEDLVVDVCVFSFINRLQ